METLKQAMAAADAAPRIDFRKLEKELDVPDETLAVLVEQLISLQRKHQEEMATQTAKIVSKINSINSAIRG